MASIFLVLQIFTYAGFLKRFGLEIHGNGSSNWYFQLPLRILVIFLLLLLSKSWWIVAKCLKSGKRRKIQMNGILVFESSLNNERPGEKRGKK